MVPRGVSVGSIDVHSTKMTFNSTTLTYRIILQADVPVFNPNYLKVCSGTVIGGKQHTHHGCCCILQLRVWQVPFWGYATDN